MYKHFPVGYIADSSILSRLVCFSNLKFHSDYDSNGEVVGIGDGNGIGDHHLEIPLATRFRLVYIVLPNFFPTMKMLQSYGRLHRSPVAHSSLYI